MIKQTIRLIIRKLGYDIVRYQNQPTGRFPPDFSAQDIKIIERVSPYTITSPERIHALIDSTRFILKNSINGDFVECGVYKGGSMMVVALTLLSEGITERELYLFDTFEGMPAPDKRDVDLWGNQAMATFSKKKISNVSSTWANASLESVKEAMALTGYPREKIHFIKGLVENTIPEKAPRSIALLRLDTDWYQSTMHELVHLYPRLSPKGVVIIDDYGHFTGTKEAVDEYFYERNMIPLLHRIDYTGRLILKEGWLNKNTT